MGQDLVPTAGQFWMPVDSLPTIVLFRRSMIYFYSLGNTRYSTLSSRNTYRKSKITLRKAVESKGKIHRFQRQSDQRETKGVRCREFGVYRIHRLAASDMGHTSILLLDSSRKTAKAPGHTSPALSQRENLF
jgi:hypothetical protein